MNPRLRVALAEVRATMPPDMNYEQIRRWRFVLVELIQASRDCRDDAEAAVRKVIL
jgi:hypothetical protein